MNPNKLIAGAIFLFLFLVPFRILYFTDEIVDGAKFIFLLLTNVIGFLVAFGIATNEPFRRKAKMQKQQGKQAAEELRKAA